MDDTTVKCRGCQTSFRELPMSSGLCFKCHIEQAYPEGHWMPRVRRIGAGRRGFRLWPLRARIANALVIYWLGLEITIMRPWLVQRVFIDGYDAGYRKAVRRMSELNQRRRPRG